MPSPAFVQPPQLGPGDLGPVLLRIAQIWARRESGEQLVQFGSARRERVQFHAGGPVRATDFTTLNAAARATWCSFSTFDVSSTGAHHRRTLGRMLIQRGRAAARAEWLDDPDRVVMNAALDLRDLPRDGEDADEVLDRRVCLAIADRDGVRLGELLDALRDPAARTDLAALLALGLVTLDEPEADEEEITLENVGLFGDHDIDALLHAGLEKALMAPPGAVPPVRGRRADSHDSGSFALRPPVVLLHAYPPALPDQLPPPLHEDVPMQAESFFFGGTFRGTLAAGDDLHGLISAADFDGLAGAVRDEQRSLIRAAVEVARSGLYARARTMLRAAQTIRFDSAEVFAAMAWIELHDIGLPTADRRKEAERLLALAETFESTAWAEKTVALCRERLSTLTARPQPVGGHVA